MTMDCLSEQPIADPVTSSKPLPEMESTEERNVIVEDEAEVAHSRLSQESLPFGSRRLPDGRILHKADISNRRDYREVDEKGNVVMTEKFLKQLCREQGGYASPELNDRIYLHFKGHSLLHSDKLM